MKVRKRMVPLDLLVVEKQDEVIIVSTHRHHIRLSAYKDGGKHIVESHDFTFDQLFTLITRLRPGIDEICDTSKAARDLLTRAMKRKPTRPTAK